MGKAHEQEFPASSKQATNVLDLIHTDLCDMPTLSCSHNKWIITFIDDASGFAALHFLQSKADAVHCFQDLVSWAEAQTGYCYINDNLRTFLLSRDIKHQTSVCCTLRQNG